MISNMLAVAKVHKTNPWVTKQSIKMLEGATAEHQKAFARPQAAMAIHAMAKAPAFTPKGKCDECKKAITKLMEADNQDILVMKSILVQQGFMNA